jgi:hypothetical protein
VAWEAWEAWEGSEVAMEMTAMLNCKNSFSRLI